MATPKLRTILLILGLCVGLGVGFGIQDFKRRIGVELARMLDDEARTAAGCSFSYESVSLSLLRQRAVASNGKIACPNQAQPVLHFDRVIAEFSLRHIRTKTIDLNLTLVGGNTNGFFDDSSTYKFIDSLATPPPPERQTPDRYKIRLQKLFVEELAGNDFIGIFNLEFSNASLALIRDAQDEFDLEAEIPTGTISLLNYPEIRAPAENLSAAMHITDNVVAIHQIRGQIDRALKVQASLDIENRPAGFLRGTVKLAGPLAETQLLNSLQIGGSFAGQVDISGSSKAPLFESTAQINSPTYQGVPGDAPLVVETSYQAGPVKVLRFPSIRGSFPRFQLQTTRQIMIDNQQSTGVLQVSARAPLAGAVEIRPTGSLLGVGVALSASITSAQGLVFSGQGEIDRILGGAPNFQASSKLRIPSFPELSIELERVENGVARASVTGAQESIKGSGQLSFQTLAGEASLNLSSVAVRDLLECGALEGNLRYRWNNLEELTVGEGSLNLSKLGFGCGVAAIVLTRPFEGAINQGTLQLDGFELTSLGKPFRLSGELSLDRGFNVNADGSLDLAAASPLVTAVDELSGVAVGRLQVQGPLASPVVAGDLAVSQLRIEQASSGIALEQGGGTVRLNGSVLELDEVSAVLNDGTVTLGGTIDISDLDRSEITASAERITLEPSDRLVLTTSGRLIIKPKRDGPATVSGAIEILGGEYLDSFTTTQLIRALQRLILQQKNPATSSLASSPDAQLDISVTATRGFFVVTNLGSAELSAALRISGSMRNPVIDGSLDSRSGWVGYSNRRFEINAAKLQFSPSASEPVLDLTAETILPARTGENVLVLLSAQGPVTNPAISLSSDLPISERELLTLVTSGGTFGSRTRANTLGLNDLAEPPRGVLEELARLNLRGFLSQLVNVDSLSVSPLFNPRTGLVEPALIAEKLLADRLTLLGETTFSGVDGITRARLQYDLSDSFAVGGLIEEDPSRTSPPTELQITFTPLSRQAQRVQFKFSGNRVLSEREILRGLRLSSLSYVTPQDVIALESALRTMYAHAGLTGTTVQLGCSSFYAESCTEVEISIQEGTPQYVSDVSVRTPGLPPELRSSRYSDRLIRTPTKQMASEEFRLQKTREVLRALRSEGYVAARVDGSYECQEIATCSLALTIDAGRPISFVFTGNTLFTPTDFLGAIRLFERPQPFGNNTPTVLANTIERMYRSEGYLFATVAFEQVRDSNAVRTVYRFSIDEGSQIDVLGVEFSGLESAALKDLLLERIHTLGLADQILSPSAAIAEDIEANAGVVAEALRSLGYEAPDVQGKIVPSPDEPSAAIVYTINLKGAAAKQLPLRFENLPPRVTLNDLLPDTEAYSFALAERASQAQQRLQSLGFPEATVSSASEQQGVLVVTAGRPQVVRDIEVTGNRTISPEVILRAAGLSRGERVTRDRLDAARRRLLMLGLFARVAVTVETASKASRADELPIVVKVDVLERAPQSVEIGAGFNSEFGFHLFGEGSDRSLFGDGRQLAARLDGYYDSGEQTVSKGTASLQFRSPFFAGTELGLSEDLRFQRFDLATLPYDLDRVSLASYLSGQSERWTYAFGHTLQHENLDNVNPDAVLGELDSGSVLIGFLSGTIAYDERDAPLNPQQGYLVSLDGKIALSAFGSDADFAEVSPRFSWAHPISTRWGIAYQLRAGWIHSFDSGEEVPITQRFFLGGRTSVRGFKENVLGAQGELGSNLGGTYFTNQNIELRYRPLEAVSFAWFLDSGSVTFDRPIAGDLRHSTGVGLRYISPIGPIGFDVGFPLERKSGEDPYRIHFTLGTIF